MLDFTGTGLLRVGRILLRYLPFLLLSGCSQTPGDAALRLGHPEAAADLYLQGAELGHSDAALKLGLLVSEGRVSSPKYKTALYWYERACELGEVIGCHNAGVSYEYGKDGASVGYNKARDYYSRAAERGYMSSQYNLGSLYSNNYLTPRDDVEGYKWMLIAERTAKGCSAQPLCEWILQDPPGHRARLKGRSSASQLQQAEAGSAAWKPRH